MPVTTTVTAVYAFEITPNGASPAIPGQTVPAVAGEQVTFVYELTNLANTGDTFALSFAQDTTADNFNFTNVQIYIDNGDGIVGSGDTLYVPGSLATYPTLTAGGTAGDSVQILVVGTIPSGTATGLGNLNLIGKSEGNDTLPDDDDNWAQASASSEPTLTLSKSVSPTTGVVPGTTLTYTLNGGNTGASNPYAVANVATVNGNVRSGFLISDDFDDDLVFGSASASYTPAVDSAEGIILYSSSPDGSTPIWTTTPGTDVNAVGYLIPFRTGERFGSALTSYQLVFTATVPTNAPFDASYSNIGVLRFDRDGEGDSDDAGETVTTPAVITEVDQVDAVALGPNAYPNGDAPAGSYVEGGITISRNADTQTVASVNNGSTVTFRHSIANNGNATDTYDLLTALLPAGFPGTVTITDVNGNTIDEITLTQGQIGEFLVTVTIPDTYVAATPTTITVTATSQNSGTLSDTTTDTLTEIVEDDTYGVTLDNGDGDTGIEAISGTTLPATPGTPVSFPLELTNDGNNNPDIFTLTSTNGVSGSTLTIYRDTDCDGVQDAGEPVVTGSITLAPGENICLVAVVTVPAGTPAASYPVSVTATSTLNAGVTSTITNTIAVGVQTTAFTLEENEFSSVDPGGQVTYTHTITNSSNAAASVAIPAVTGAPTGWVYEYSTDGGTNWVTSITGLNVPAGDTQELLVRVTVPANAPDNASHTATITATATYPDNSTAVDPVTDTTTVTDGSLSVLKTVDETEAAPGDSITYTITATNDGTRPLNNVRVYDTLPDNAGTAIADTEFVSVVAAVNFSGTLLYSTNGTTWGGEPDRLGASGTFYVGVDTNGDNTITTADTMPVGTSIVVTFVVQVADGQ